MQAAQVFDLGKEANESNVREVTMLALQMGHLVEHIVISFPFLIRKMKLRTQEIFVFIKHLKVFRCHICASISNKLHFALFSQVTYTYASD